MEYSGNELNVPIAATHTALHDDTLPLENASKRPRTRLSQARNENNPRANQGGARAHRCFEAGSGSKQPVDSNRGYRRHRNDAMDGNGNVEALQKAAGGNEITRKPERLGFNRARQMKDVSNTDGENHVETKPMRPPMRSREIQNNSIITCPLNKGQIYSAVVTKVVSFGVFVKINHVQTTPTTDGDKSSSEQRLPNQSFESSKSLQQISGLVHISELVVFPSPSNSEAGSSALRCAWRDTSPGQPVKDAFIEDIFTVIRVNDKISVKFIGFHNNNKEQYNFSMKRVYFQKKYPVGRRGDKVAHEDDCETKATGRPFTRVFQSSGAESRNLYEQRVARMAAEVEVYTSMVANARDWGAVDWSKKAPVVV